MKATALLAFLAAVLALALPAATRADDPQGCGAQECIGSTPGVPSPDPQPSADPGRTWSGAGVEARHRMAAPAVGGFASAAGDIWALNELSSDVRRGSGLSRQNMREFVPGLYDGDGGPPMKGLVWVAGISQGT